MNLLINGEGNECVILLINTIPRAHFIKFIDSVIFKENLASELCWCSFEIEDGKEYYRFETFEDETYELSYSEFVDIVKLAIIRFYLGTDDKEMKDALEEHTKNTIFDSILDNIDPTLDSGIPLVYS